MAQVLSVNAGGPQQVPVRGGEILTSMYKTPVSGRVAVRRHNIDGDRQSDLTVHGGPSKAVYCYPHEHYEYWAEQLPEIELGYGNFGENLTTEGLLEEEVAVGDRFRAGSALLQVTQPRMPCFKLNLRFDRADMVKRFWRSGRPGIYFAVLEEGDVAAGDAIVMTEPAPLRITLSDVVRLHTGQSTDPDLLERAMRAPLAGSWKADIMQRFSEPRPS
jgi:MOSC domain-containing protein YiiM